jgi:hypothetical protein
MTDCSPEVSVENHKSEITSAFADTSAKITETLIQIMGSILK